MGSVTRVIVVRSPTFLDAVLSLAVTLVSHYVRETSSLE